MSTVPFAVFGIRVAVLTSANLTSSFGIFLRRPDRIDDLHAKIDRIADGLPIFAEEGKWYRCVTMADDNCICGFDLLERMAPGLPA